MWKCCDPANANRDVVLYAFLAREGLTAPGEPFEGQWGLWNQSRAGNVELEPFACNNQSFKVTQIGQKFFPCHGHGDPAISLALQLRDKVKLDEIEAINVQSYRKALHSVGGGPDKPERLNPQTREDADHSIPWLVATAFWDGAFTAASFKPERVRDPKLRPLMQRVKVVENPEFTRQYPQLYNATMEVVTRSGDRYTAAASYPKGHPMNPLTDQELEAKFTGLAQGVLSPRQCTEVLDLLWRLEELKGMGPIFDALQV
jgi:2-methylcitrate dehydratase